MSRESRMLGGVLLVVFPTVMYGGLSLLTFLTRNVPEYNDNPLRHDLWRAGHAHGTMRHVAALGRFQFRRRNARNSGITPCDRYCV